MNKTTIATFIILITLAVVSLLPRTAFAQMTEGNFTSECSLCGFGLVIHWRLGGKQAVQEYIDAYRESLERARYKQALEEALEDENEEYVTDYVDNWNENE